MTNYHVVAQAVLYPRQYRFEYLASDGRTGPLHVLAIDVRNDLAVVAANDLELPALRLRCEIPAQGERAWSIGFPLNLGLTITEGVANGLVENSIDQRIHYTGAINGGMSGGPALDTRGRVYGVNVSVITGRQLVGFVVPAKHIPALLARAKQPLDASLSAQQLRQRVTAQVLATRPRCWKPSRTRPAHRACGATRCRRRSRGTSNATRSTNAARTPACAWKASVAGYRPAYWCSPASTWPGCPCSTGSCNRWSLHPLQFERQVNRLAATPRRSGASAHVAPFACSDALVSLDGFDARISTCVRQYRLFAGLYDFDVTVVGIDDTQQALVSRLALQGVGFGAGKRIMERYLGALQWTP